jgi:hypothetical protein
MENFIIHNASMAELRHNMWFQSITQRLGSLCSNVHTNKHTYIANGKQVSLGKQGTTRCRKAGDRTVQYVYVYNDCSYSISREKLFYFIKQD